MANDEGALFATAFALQTQGAGEKAIPIYRRLLALQPRHTNAWNNLGVLFNSLARHDDALECFDHLVALDPSKASYHSNRGVALRNLGRDTEAIAAYRQAVAVDPTFHTAHNNLGNILIGQGDHAGAAEHFQAAARTRPDLADYRFMLGKALVELGQDGLGEAQLKAALRLEPNHADAWGILARIWSERHKMAEALACFEHGVAVRSDYPGLLYNRGLARLLAGDFVGGWADYEYRWQVPDFPSKRLPVKQPVWNGEPLAGKTLLVHAEQGLGDSLQFLRYLPEIAQRAARVLLLLQETLSSLVVLPENVELLREGQAYPAFDFVCPLLSLPHLIGGDILAIPSTIPYLHADPRRIGEWEQRLAGPGLRVGLVWAGNPSHKNDANRSVDLALLAPLLAIDNIRFFSLQVGARGADIAACHVESSLQDLTPHIKDFSDTAAALLNLDLLICVDTSTAHVAGALGVPVWLLLPWMPDWRWLLEREDSPWYPGMRLFRQPAHGDWASVMERLGRELREIASPTSKAGRARLAQANTFIEEGRTLLDGNERPAAVSRFWRAIFHHPLGARAWSGLAIVAYRANQPHNAVLFGQRACRLNPKDPENWSNCGAYLKAAGSVEEAVRFQRQAVELNPRSASAQSNLANALGAVGRWDEARTWAQKALKSEPNSPDYHYNHGIILKELGDYPAAQKAFQKAQALSGGHVKARLHEALIDLAQTDFAAGWEGYESRWLQPDCKEKRSFPKPLWNGEAITGKRVLVHAEQGFGDSFQFLRYIPMLEHAGASVILVVQPDIESLARRLGKAVEVISSGHPLPPYDVHCPLLSLPRAFGTRLDTIPADIPYLTPDPAKVRQWRKRLPTGKKPCIAIVWAGRPTHANDANRSMLLNQWRPFLADSRCQFISLQKGPATAQLAKMADTNILDLGASINNFEDTAAILSLVDLVIAVDTSVAHLAGALGRPVKVFLPFIPDWRWLLNRPDSPWYPTLRLYRQEVRGDWSAALATLTADLDQELTAGKFC